MKKALSTAIIATILIASSAWADTVSNTSVSDDSSEREFHQENRREREDRREMRKEMRNETRGEIKDFRQEHRDDMKEAKTECRTRLEVATTDTEKETIKAECKAEAKEAREALRENIKTLREAKYTAMLASFKTQLEGNLDTIKALSAEKKTEWKVKVGERLDDLEDKANERGNDNLVLTIAALREIVASV
ncbi:hypothetical protein KBB89_02230 [Candidatus Gracilibacteria bacterium]|nr:hypothetical protein [Candidatus Gracilibacteria bacterium]